MDTLGFIMTRKQNFYYIRSAGVIFAILLASLFMLIYGAFAKVAIGTLIPLMLVFPASLVAGGCLAVMAHLSGGYEPKPLTWVQVLMLAFGAALAIPGIIFIQDGLYPAGIVGLVVGISAAGSGVVSLVWMAYKNMNESVLKFTDQHNPLLTNSNDSIKYKTIESGKNNDSQHNTDSNPIEIELGVNNGSQHNTDSNIKNDDDSQNDAISQSYSAGM